MRNTHQPQPVRILIADYQAMSAQRIQEMVVSNFEIIGILPDDAEQALSQALWLKPDIVLINVAARAENWSHLAKRIIEELPRTRVLLYQNDNERTSAAPEISTRELSNREYEVLALLATGYPMKQVASRLGIAYRTVAFHKYHMMEKLGITTTAGLMRYALNRNIREGFAPAYNGTPRGSNCATNFVRTNSLNALGVRRHERNLAEKPISIGAAGP